MTILIISKILNNLINPDVLNMRLSKIKTVINSKNNSLNLVETLVSAANIVFDYCMSSACISVNFMCIRLIN